MSLEQVALIVDQVVSALAAAHAAGITHRDLKPANIFIEKLSGRDRDLVRVLDFGISKVRDAKAATRTSVVIGTPHYMSPEQALGRSKTLDGRSDQFALGAIVHELLTGRQAFGGDDPDDDPAPSVLFRVVHGEPRAFTACGLNLPSVELVIRKALAKEPDHRYADVAAFGKAFEEAVRREAGHHAGALPVVAKLSEAPRTQLREVSTLSGSAGEPRALEPVAGTGTERGKQVPTRALSAGNAGKARRFVAGGVALALAGLAAVVFRTGLAGSPKATRSQAASAEPRVGELAVPITTAKSSATSAPLAAAVGATAPVSAASVPVAAPPEASHPAVIEVDDAPPSLTIWENNKEKTLPLTWPSRVGTHTVAFKAPGYKDLTLSLRPEVDRRISLKKMKREHGGPSGTVHNLDI